MNNNPIGVFDSGLGGLSVWRELRRSLPQESLFYFGDGKNCPYGSKPKEDIIRFVEYGVRILLDNGAKMIVIACNAATASAVDFLRNKYDIPIIGMEPAVKPAAKSTKTGVVGVLATERTLAGDLFRETVARYSDSVRVISAVGEGFVELVEAGLEATEQAFDMVSKVMEPMLEQGADKIVLGCTHYPFLHQAMQRAIGRRDVEIIDPAAAIEQRVEYLLDECKIRAYDGHVAQYKFFSAAGDDYCDKIRSKSRAIFLDSL